MPSLNRYPFSSLKMLGVTVLMDTRGLDRLNSEPFVLQAQAGATLFWINAQPLANGQPFNQIYYAPLNDQGQPGAPAPLFLRPDASVQRFSPRAIYDGQNSYVFYYGGSSGRWTSCGAM